jgi:hypothetical protein
MSVLRLSSETFEKFSISSAIKVAKKLTMLQEEAEEAEDTSIRLHSSTSNPEGMVLSI